MEKRDSEDALKLSGVLDLRAGQEWFAVDRRPPAPALADLVAHYWTVTWDRRGLGPYVQSTLSNVAVHLCAEPGVSRIQGVFTGLFSHSLEGRSGVFGVKFRPAGFRPFLGSSVAALTDRSCPIGEVFGTAGEALAEELIGLRGDISAQAAAADALLHSRLPEPDPMVSFLNDVADLVIGDREITSVERLAARAGLGKRTLQRLFSEYLGVNPKWVIRRYRLHEAVDRLDAGAEVDLAQLALDLGYFDQSHFARDFKAIVGRAPTQYARAQG